ncbi:MAG: para-nitrobenzyl esterase, partial [Acidobacteriota bacterium]
MRQAAALVTIAIALGIGFGPAPVDPTAAVVQGSLEGTTDNGVTAFFGVPFAAPPVGDLRWAPPRPAASWGSQIRSAKKFGTACTQTLRASGSGQWTSEYMSPEPPGVSEDCLLLNVWTPATLTGGARPPSTLPVLFWIYGGGFNEG